MKLWKIIGYCFVSLGLLVFGYGFTVAFMDMLSPSKIWGMASSGQTVDFFSTFGSAITGWTALSVALFIVGGIGLFVGRNRKIDKLSNEERISELEETLRVISGRLDELEGKLRTND